MTFRTDEKLIQAFSRDGAVVLRGLFSTDEIGCLTKGIEANISAPSWRSKIASSADDPGCFFEDFCNWQDNEQYRSFIQDSDLAVVAAQLMQSREVRLFHDHLLVKEPSTLQRTPWHQDQPYYNVEGRQNVSFWIPVDPVTRNSTLELVAGSHLGGWLMPRTFLNEQAKWFPEGSMSEVPDIEAQRNKYPILGWAVEPGDAVAFHMLTLHATAGVSGEQRRRVFSARFLGDDVVHAPRTWVTSPDFPGLKDELPDGVPMDHPLFPRLLPPEQKAKLKQT